MLKPKNPTTMRDVALALSSGGARGLAHIGAIEELEQQGYRIRSVAGCSMGALVGGMYAAGRLAEFKEWMQTVDRRKMLSLLDLSLSINHLVKGEKVIDALKEIVPDVAIEDLPVEYQAIATDWKNGREVVFSKGSLCANFLVNTFVSDETGTTAREEVLRVLSEKQNTGYTDILFAFLVSLDKTVILS